MEAGAVERTHEWHREVNLLRVQSFSMCAKLARDPDDKELEDQAAANDAKLIGLGVEPVREHYIDLFVNGASKAPRKRVQRKGKRK
jgi:hypothetical protein